MWLTIRLASQDGISHHAVSLHPGHTAVARNGGAWEYLLPDALGSVRQIVDASGNVTLAESYEPYGTVLTSTGTASSIFGYAGEQVDTTGLIYLRARYMNPGLGLFLARDPWNGDEMRPGSMNGFGYVEGNPVNLTDPSGQCPPIPVIPSLVEKKAYMTYVSQDDGYSGKLSLHIASKAIFPACPPCNTKFEDYSWGAVSGNRDFVDLTPIPPAIYFVDPSMRRSLNSFGRDTCFDFIPIESRLHCPFGRKWSEDGWGKERLSLLKYPSGEGDVYFIHGGNEARGTAGCIKVKNDELTD